MHSEHGPAFVARPGERFVYLRYSPESDSRQVLLLVGKRNWGSLDFDVCDRCRRVHVWTFTLLAVLQNEGYEAEMLRLARAQVSAQYRWTYDAMAERTDQYWTGDPRPMRNHDYDDLCVHLKDEHPGKLRDLWSRLHYWHLTGQLHWPDWL